MEEKHGQNGRRGYAAITFTTTASAPLGAVGPQLIKVKSISGCAVPTGIIRGSEYYSNRCEDFRVDFGMLVGMGM